MFRRWGDGKSTDEMIDEGGEWCLDTGMKLLLSIFSISMFMLGCGQPDQSDPDVVEDAPIDYFKLNGLVDYSKLVDRDDGFYLPNEETPFTGRAAKFYENGQQEMESNYKDGKQNGLDTWWHENGQKYKERNYKDGEKDGLETHWYENGQKWLEVNWKDGREDGLETWWLEDGQKESEQNWKDGLPVKD